MWCQNTDFSREKKSNLFHKYLQVPSSFPKNVHYFDDHTPDFTFGSALEAERGVDRDRVEEEGDARGQLVVVQHLGYQVFIITIVNKSIYIST